MNRKPVSTDPLIAINTHSSIRIQSAAGTVIYVDPIELGGADADADVILVTHTHHDHLEAASIKALRKQGTQVACPPDGVKELVSLGIAKNDITAVKPEGAYQFCLNGEVIDVQTVPSYNMSKRFHPKANGWVGYVVTVDGKRVYVCGDTDATPEAQAVVCDILLLPVGGTYTMNAKEAAALVNSMPVKPGLVIPEHYGTIAGGRDAGEVFAKAVAPGIDIALPY